MEPATIVAGVIAVLTPYVKKGAREFAEAAGEAGYAKAKALLQTLRARWAGDAEASDTLDRFEQKPDRYAPVLEDIMQEKIDADPGLAGELDGMLRELAPTLEILQQLDTARNVTGLKAGRVSGGNTRVTQTIRDADGVTGASIDHLG